MRLVAQLLLPFQATHYFACSTQSAEFLFPSWIIRSGNFTVLPNAIPLEQFTYSPTNRQRKRNEMGIPEEAFVIGHVGRFCSQKNHEKLVRVFAEIHRRHAGSLLLLAGQGELQEKIVGLCEELKLGNTVRFLGIRSDIEQLMQAFDLFILPSFYEGFPVVGVEAQAADLPCLFSGQIKKDIALTVNVRFLPLRAPDTVWADNALELRRTVRKDRSEELAKQGFDIRRQAKRMEEFYQSVGGG